MKNKERQRRGGGEFYKKLSENPSSSTDSIAIDLGPSNSTSVYSSGPSTYRQSPFYSGTSSAYPPPTYPSQPSSTSQTKTRRRPQSPATPSSQPSSGGYAAPAPRVVTETTPTIASSAPRPATTTHSTAPVSPPSLPTPPIAPIAAPAGDDDIFGLAYLLILHQCATELKTQLEGESFWWFRGDRAERDRIAILAKTTAFTNYRTLTGIHGDTALTMTQKQTIQSATVALLALVKKIKISPNYLFFLSSFRPALPHFISVYDGYLEDKLKHRTQEIKRLVTEKQTLTNQVMELKPKTETESPIYLHGQIDLLSGQVKEKQSEVTTYTDALKNISAIVEYGEHAKKLDNIAATLATIGITARPTERRSSSSSSTSKEEKSRSSEKEKDPESGSSNSSLYR